MSAATATRPTALSSVTAPAAATTTTPTPPEAAQPPLDYAQVYAEMYPRTLARARRELAQGGRGRQNADACGDGLLAEDLTQEAWLSVWRNWPTLAEQPLGVVSAFAHRTLTNLMIDRWRRHQMARRNGQERMTEATWDVAQRMVIDPSQDDQPEAAALTHETLTEVWALVVSGSVTRSIHTGMARRRDTARDMALFEALLDGELQAQTAARLGLTIGQVKMGRWRLCNRLQAHLLATHSDKAAKSRHTEEK